MKKSFIWKNIIIWLIVLTAMAVFLNRGSAVGMKSSDRELVVSGNSGASVTIAYADIQTIEMREYLDYGTVVDGVDGKKEKSGTWKNEEFGEYRLCVDAKVNSCIVLYMESEIQVINIESNESTASLYEAILKLVDNTE